MSKGCQGRMVKREKEKRGMQQSCGRGMKGLDAGHDNERDRNAEGAEEQRRSTGTERS